MSVVLPSGSNLLILAETWLTNDITDAEVLNYFPNFNLCREDRKGERGGGVHIAVSEQLSCAVINIKSDLKILSLICRAVPISILLRICYRQPHYYSDFSPKFNDMLNQLTNERPNAHILLFGDFNFSTTDWTNSTPLIVSSTESREFIKTGLHFHARSTRFCKSFKCDTNQPSGEPVFHYLPLRN